MAYLASLETQARDAAKRLETQLDVVVHHDFGANLFDALETRIEELRRLVKDKAASLKHLNTLIESLKHEQPET